MKVEAYIIAWNEADTIALTIRHYQSFCNNVTLFDSFSDDGTTEIAAKMGARVIKFGIPGVLDDREYTKLKNECWKGSKADWVIVVDCDEILINKFGPMRDVLKECLKNGSKILRPQGWQVISNDMPEYDWAELSRGYKDDNYSKLCCFSPTISDMSGVSASGFFSLQDSNDIWYAKRIFPYLLNFKFTANPQNSASESASEQCRSQRVVPDLSTLIFSASLFENPEPLMNCAIVSMHELAAGLSSIACAIRRGRALSAP